MKNIIIDTDVGTDVDDLFALVYVLKTSNNIQAIRTVHGNTEIRVKIAGKLEKLLNKTVPIIPGAEKTLDNHPKYWCGFEKDCLTDEELKEQLKTQQPITYNKDSIIVAIGPLTNIVLDIKNNPEIKNVEKIYLMGSHKDSHNFKVDPIATNIVLNYNWKKYFITKETALQIVFTKNELEALAVNPLGKFLYESAIRWLDYTNKTLVPMYDVLAVSAALEEDYIKFKEVDGKIISDKVYPALKDKLIKIILSN